MSHVPPPSMHLCFSASKAHEKGFVIRSLLSDEEMGGSMGGLHVAMVKASTSLRTKNLGKVPPKFETL